MILQTGQPIIAKHILPNTPRNKSYSTIKFGQLIENKVRKTFFLKNYTQNVVEKLDLFIKN